jgi:hypothetical protein
MSTLVSVVIALVVLALVLRFLSPRSRNVQVQAAQPSMLATPDEVRLGSVQMSKPAPGEPLYVDGVITNVGKDSIGEATVEVDFRDAKGQLAGSVQKHIAGMGHGETAYIRDDFAKNPIQPNEVRFFRVAVEQPPPAWNNQIPELQIVEVNAP